jgi:hypothetical protein
MFALPFPNELVILCVGFCVQMTCLAVVVVAAHAAPLDEINDSALISRID